MCVDNIWYVGKAEKTQSLYKRSDNDKTIQNIMIPFITIANLIKTHHKMS